MGTTPTPSSVSQSHGRSQDISQSDFRKKPGKKNVSYLKYVIVSTAYLSSCIFQRLPKSVVDFRCCVCSSVDEIIEIIRKSSLSDMPRRVAEVGEGR